MKTTKKIIMIGSSKGIIIDKPIIKKMNLKVGGLVEITIKKLK